MFKGMMKVVYNVDFEKIEIRVAQNIGMCICCHEIFNDYENQFPVCRDPKSGVLERSVICRRCLDATQ